ncbi:MAG: cyclase family protein [Ilumatobacteraceae bacterium]
MSEVSQDQMVGHGAPAVDPPWLQAAYDRHRLVHTDDCIGSIRHIDAAARLRGTREVSRGLTLSLSRALSPGAAGGTPSLAPAVYHVHDATLGTDSVEVQAHGVGWTHIDSLTHVGLAGTWHSGERSSAVPVDDDSLVSWANHGIVTRGVVVDVPRLRGTPWVAVDQPVTADELDRCLSTAGVKLHPGDALLVYMGRDRYEASGHVVEPILKSHGRPGIGESGARWISEQDLGLLCWDFLDAVGDDDGLCVHRLIWAIGLALVDNCDLAAVARLHDVVTGMLVIAPVPLQGATGCLVNPLFTI